MRSRMRPLGTLYLVYWGAGEPLGEALVLPSVKRLGALGANVTLVTFEKGEDFAHRGHMTAIRNDLDASNIRWIPLRYHRRPQAAAKMYDAINGWARSIAAEFGRRTDIVHARTFFGGLIGLVLARLLRAKFVYHN